MRSTRPRISWPRRPWLSPSPRVGSRSGHLHDSLVYGVTTTDPLAFTLAPVALLVIATVAALVPARRATRVTCASRTHRTNPP